MRRRLTLAPAIKAKLRPRLPSSSVIKDSLLDADYTSARAELSAIVESVAAICSKPPAKHGIEFPSSKFWRGNMDSDESDEEVDEEIIVEEEGNPRQILCGSCRGLESIHTRAYSGGTWRSASLHRVYSKLNMNSTKVLW